MHHAIGHEVVGADKLLEPHPDGIHDLVEQFRARAGVFDLYLSDGATGRVSCADGIGRLDRRGWL